MSNQGTKISNRSKFFRLLDGESEHYDIMLLAEAFAGIVIKITAISIAPADGTYLDPNTLDDSVKTTLSYTYEVKNPDILEYLGFSGDDDDRIKVAVGDIIIEILESSFDSGEYRIGASPD